MQHHTELPPPLSTSESTLSLRSYSLLKQQISPQPSSGHVRSVTRTKTYHEQYVLASMVLSSSTETVLSQSEHRIRAVTAGHAVGLYSGILKRMRTTEIHSPGGVYLGDVETFTIATERFRPFLENIGKGLWVRHTLTIPTWDDYTVDVQLKQLTSFDSPLQKPAFLDMLSAARWGAKWGSAFEYAGGGVASAVTYWILLFYGTHLGLVSFRRTTDTTSPTLPSPDHATTPSSPPCPRMGKQTETCVPFARKKAQDPRAGARLIQLRFCEASLIAKRAGRVLRRCSEAHSRVGALRRLANRNLLRA